MTFKKGNIPWNKNKKGIHLSPETEFKRGHATWNKNKKGLQVPWNKGLTGRELLDHYKEKQPWNKGLTKENNAVVRKVAGNLSGKNNYAWLGEKLEINCDNCGKKVRRRSLTEINRSEKLFCCQKCRDEYFSGLQSARWKVGYTPYYGPNWYRQRRLALERDEHACQFCGILENGREHDVHHFISFGYFGPERYLEANQLENLITLCQKCHSMCQGIEFAKFLIDKEKKSKGDLPCFIQ